MRLKYRDRKCSAKLGIYENKVSDNMANYLVPQEYGNKTDVRWAKVHDEYLINTSHKIKFEFSFRGV
jgi:hypothetical protein